MNAERSLAPEVRFAPEPKMSPELERFCTRPFPFSEPQICVECDGTGVNGDTGEGDWDMADCDHCGGSGYEPESTNEV